MEKERLCIKELAALKGVDRVTVYNWMKSGIIPKDFIHRQLNGRVFFIKTEIEGLEKRADELLHHTT